MLICGNCFACQFNGPDAIDACGLCAFRQMTIAYVFFQVVLPLEDLLLVMMGADGARVTLVPMCGPMPKKGVSPCIRSSAEWFRTSPGFVWDPFGVLVQFLKVPEDFVTLLADVALLVVLVRVFRLGRRI